MWRRSTEACGHTRWTCAHSQRRRGSTRRFEAVCDAYRVSRAAWRGDETQPSLGMDAYYNESEGEDVSALDLETILVRSAMCRPPPPVHSSHEMWLWTLRWTHISYVKWCTQG